MERFKSSNIFKYAEISGILSLYHFLEHEVGKIISVRVVYAVTVFTYKYLVQACYYKLSIPCYHGNVRYLQLSHSFQKRSGKI